MPEKSTFRKTTRAAAYALWMQAPNPMVTLFLKLLTSPRLVKISKNGR